MIVLTSATRGSNTLIRTTRADITHLVCATANSDKVNPLTHRMRTYSIGMVQERASP